jgi:hypothetical protein
VNPFDVNFAISKLADPLKPPPMGTVPSGHIAVATEEFEMTDWIEYPNGRFAQIGASVMDNWPNGLLESSRACHVLFESGKLASNVSFP